MLKGNTYVIKPLIIRVAFLVHITHIYFIYDHWNQSTHFNYGKIYRLNVDDGERVRFGCVHILFVILYHMQVFALYNNM